MSEVEQARTKTANGDSNPSFPNRLHLKTALFSTNCSARPPRRSRAAFLPRSMIDHLPRSCGSEWPIKGLKVLSRSAFRTLPPPEQKYSSRASSLTSPMAEIRGPETAPSPPDTEDPRLPVGWGGGGGGGSLLHNAVAGIISCVVHV